VTNKDKIKRVFGVEMPHWEIQLRSCLTGLVAAGAWQKTARVFGSCSSSGAALRGGR